MNILEKYKDHYDKKLNFTELLSQLKIPISESDEIISLLLDFQNIFKNVFKEYRLKKQRTNNKVYLIVEAEQKDEPPKTICILRSHIKLLNDIIYTFKYVKRGKGFDLSRNGSDLLANVKMLKIAYPYLFELHGNGVIYPSQLGLKLGELIISYNKSNKEITNIQFENYTIIVEDER
jgi:hypothetical protein